MPRLELALDLEPTQSDELGLRCWFCERPGCEWKFALPVEPGKLLGLHTKCKISLEQKRSPSRTMAAVKPP